MTLDAVPEIRDELERKALETYDWMLQRVSSGQLSESELKVAAQTAFSIIGGLVSDKIMQVVSVIEPNSLANTVIRRVFSDAKKPTSRQFCVLSWEVGSQTVHLTLLREDESPLSQQLTFQSALNAKAAFEKLCNRMLERGMKEIV